MENLDYHYTVETTKSAEEVRDSLDSSLKQAGFGVLWSFDVHQKLAEKGYPIDQEITILEVCNPKEAARILKMDSMASYFLPCKIVITTTVSSTLVGMVRPSIIIKVINNQKLENFALKIEADLVNIIDSAI